jgi:DNA repair ATPase RecN
MESFEKTIEEYKANYEFEIKKLQEQYTQKLNTLEPVLMQLHRKDENIDFIQDKINQFEKKGQQMNKMSKQPNGKQENT